jgi:hypothetical protein
VSEGPLRENLDTCESGSTQGVFFDFSPSVLFAEVGNSKDSVTFGVVIRSGCSLRRWRIREPEEATREGKATIHEVK